MCGVVVSHKNSNMKVSGSGPGLSCHVVSFSRGRILSYISYMSEWFSSSFNSLG